MPREEASRKTPSGSTPRFVSWRPFSVVRVPLVKRSGYASAFWLPRLFFYVPPPWASGVHHVASELRRIRRVRGIKKLHKLVQGAPAKELFALLRTFFDRCGHAPIQKRQRSSKRPSVVSKNRVWVRRRRRGGGLTHEYKKNTFLYSIFLTIRRQEHWNLLN